ncbi:hypothetical protein FOH38_00720 [Lysinibacillus fusiformis]|nr:hypothetical protein FOH38_00720 [Lysinibacillus fusiformis]
MAQVNELTTFQYETLDESTADYLRRKELNMREIVGKAYTALGKELKEAQDTLAKNGYGCFEEWYTKALGMNRKMVSRLIQRYDLIVTNCHEQELLEDLPVSLTYEVAKPSADSTPSKAQAKLEVLNGDIDTLKEYRERIIELESHAKQATEKAEQAEYARQIAEEKALRIEQVFGKLATSPSERRLSKAD